MDETTPRATRIPVTVLTGFLGSGKTTLLNRILTEQHGKRIAVIENEFGEIGIDQALVIRADEEIFEMNNGCICCTVRGDLIRILGNLKRRRERFDHVLVETTGVADPGPVAQTFFVDEEVSADFALDGIVTMIDAKHVSLHLDDSAECQAQIAFADVIILNKTDLVSEAELARIDVRIRSMNTMARVEHAVNAAVSMERVLDVGGFDLARALATKPAFLEPEYPFEWLGIFALETGESTLCLAEGPDPSMTVLLLPVPSEGEDALRAAAEEGLRRFAERPVPLSSGEALSPSQTPFRLDLSAPGAKSFPLRVFQPGRYALFSEHLPEEFTLTLRSQDDVTLSPSIARPFAAAHGHDGTVSSVGIHAEGTVDSGRLNAWVSALLRERGTDIFRMKGILNVDGQENRYVFQGVHMLIDGCADRPWGSAPRVNDLVFIGRNLDRAALNEGFRRCLL